MFCLNYITLLHNLKQNTFINVWMETTYFFYEKCKTRQKQDFVSLHSFGLLKQHNTV